MKIAELKDILKSMRGYPQKVVIYDTKTGEDVDDGVAEYITEHYGDMEVERISSAPYRDPSYEGNRGHCIVIDV